MAGQTIVTINREFGSKGYEVAKALAERTGADFYDKELIQLAAKESGISETLFQSADEKPSNSLLYSMVMSSYTTKGLFVQPEDLFTNDRLFAIQADVIRKIAEKGPAVIVGRCADFILRGNERLVTVFTYAPFESRLKAMTEIMKNKPDAKEHSEKNIEQLIKKTDKRRSSYYNYYTSRVWSDAKNYHLSLNTADISVSAAVDLILAYAEAKNGK